MLNRIYLKAWIASFAACAVVTAFCFLWLDLPVARIFEESTQFVRPYGLASSIILAGECLVITALALARMMQGKLPEPAKALMLASLTSILAFAANNYVAKPFFGVPNTGEVFNQSIAHTFRLLGGNPQSSFPSGHMALAGGFAGVWIRLYPTTTRLFVGLLVFGMAVLMIGDWHFLSDVVAGAFLGVTAGLMAGELWREHEARRNG